MKGRYISLFIIFVLIVTVIYLWNGKKEATKEYELSYNVQLSKDLDFLSTSIMKNSIPDTFELYDNNFTKEELDLFEHSLRNINQGLSVAADNLEKTEAIASEDDELSEAVEALFELFSDIHENAESIDEDVFFQIGELSSDYSWKLQKTYFQRSNPEDVYEKVANVVGELYQEIEKLLEE